VAGGAVEDCAAALQLKSVNPTTSAKSLHLMARPPFARISPETIHQQNEKCVANQEGPVRPWKFIFATSRPQGVHSRGVQHAVKS
jgi:hypothetical protein